MSQCLPNILSFAPKTHSRAKCNCQTRSYAQQWGYLRMTCCLVCCVLMSDPLIHLKGCAKTAPLHTTLPANPRHWLDADSKATPVGLCSTRSQVGKSSRITPTMNDWIHELSKQFIQSLIRSATSDQYHMRLWFAFVFCSYDSIGYFQFIITVFLRRSPTQHWYSLMDQCWTWLWSPAEASHSTLYTSLRVFCYLLLWT